MTKEEQNQIIKDTWVRHLLKEGDIPEDIGLIYRNWVLGKVQEASSQLTAQGQAAQQQAEGGQEQEAS